LDLNRDRDILRGLAERYAVIAALPVHAETRRLWRKLNALKPERPMVMIDQVCWSEMDFDGSLTLMCRDGECRGYEQVLRRALFQWEHFRADMVFEPVITVHKAVSNCWFDIHAVEQTLAVNETNEVVSHRYVNQFTSMEDVYKVIPPEVRHDEAETKRRIELARWLFDGIIEPLEYGVAPHLSVWDPVSQWMGAEGFLYALIDQPDMLHALGKRVSDGYMSMLDQLEEQGLLCHHQPLIHCTGAYTDELPVPGFDPLRPRTQDIWMFGLAQLFSTVSPAMFDEYEIAYSTPIFERFGLVYYGCCDPLHDKMKQVKKIPNLRKISMSPWADLAAGAREIGTDYVFSRKPNPSYLAMQTFDRELIRSECAETMAHCKNNGCPLEYILKDISTVGGRPERLFEWEDIVMREVRR
jgi:hypothetical protein